MSTSHHSIPLVLLLWAVLPAAANAAGPTDDIFDVMAAITDILSIVYYVLWALSIVVFLYGLVKFIAHASEDSPAHEAGRQLMLWGVILFTVFLSLWAIVQIVISTFGLSISGPSFIDKNG
jgi:hypothetical protein